mmetsp:Transcript_73766/g.240261  ORF Transcript_73766/g.240261 Transcript_73766/m.240261 type:complete len:234 (-) Transcript_73766:354-1055(-)
MPPRPGPALLLVRQFGPLLHVLRPAVLRVETRRPWICAHAIGLPLAGIEWWPTKHSVEFGLHQDFLRHHLLRRRCVEARCLSSLRADMVRLHDAGLRYGRHVGAPASAGACPGLPALLRIEVVRLHLPRPFRPRFRAWFLALVPLRGSPRGLGRGLDRLQLPPGGGRFARPRLQALLVPGLLGFLARLAGSSHGHPWRALDCGRLTGLRGGALQMDGQCIVLADSGGGLDRLL